MSQDTQADLRLVNLVSRGYTLAEARKKLSLDKAEPAPKPTQLKQAPKPSKVDESML